MLFDGYNHFYLARRREWMTPNETDSLIGAHIRARGFLEDYDNKSTLRRIRNMLIVHNPNGIEVLTRPSWWTPSRISAAFVSLLALLLIFLFRERTRKKIAQSRITSRQSEILQFLVDGHSNLDIATRLKISIETLKDHIDSIYTKLGAANRTEAVAIALRKHLLKI